MDRLACVNSGPPTAPSQLAGGRCDWEHGERQGQRERPGRTRPWRVAAEERRRRVGPVRPARRRPGRARWPT